MNKNNQVIVVIGPTASGKSDFAVELALKLGGEIISADSRQIYKDLDIGTGKITNEEMKGIPHYMLDIINPGEDFSVAEYRKLATPILKDIISRKKTPIICGGTGQYIDSLILDSHIPEVKANKKLREDLENKSKEELYDEILKKDPVRATNIDKHNKVRLVRALEVISSLGTVPTQNAPQLAFNTDIYILSPARDLLRERISKRLEKRFESGMIQEVKQIMEKGYSPDNMKRFGLEYYSIGKFLEGTLSEKEMREELANKICQYAKRQETWNKKYLKYFPDSVITIK